MDGSVWRLIIDTIISLSNRFLETSAHSTNTVRCKFTSFYYEKFNTFDNRNEIVRVYKISAVTLPVKTWKSHANFIPAYLVLGCIWESYSDSFTTFEIGEHSTYKMYLNLEVKSDVDSTILHNSDKMDFGRMIFYTEDADELYSRYTNEDLISELVLFEK